MLGKIKLGKVRSGIDEFVNKGLIKLCLDWTYQLLYSKKGRENQVCSFNKAVTRDRCEDGVMLG